MSEVSEAVYKCISLGDEPEWFEYKQGKAVSKPDEVGEYISALSNAAVVAGEPYGYLIWGIQNETHKIIGTEFKYQRDVGKDGKDYKNGNPSTEPFQHYISRNLSPAISFRFDEDELEGKRVVVLFVPAAMTVPTAYCGERYIRIGSSKENLKKYPEREADLFRVLIERRNPTGKWETQKSKYHVADINNVVFQKYLTSAKTADRITIDSDEPKDVLNTIEVADGDVLLNAGTAIFVDSGINELAVAHFATDEPITLIDSDRLTGSILGLTDKAVQYISGAMDWRAEFDGSVRRKEIPEIPVAALREAVINAFAHRLIEARQAVEIRIFKSFINISSYGLFPENLEPEDFIREHIKPPRRNPLITKTLYYSRDMEALATGIKRIDDECKKAGVQYEFVKEKYGFTVKFYRHCGDGWGQGESQVFSGKQPNKQPNISKSEEIKLRAELVLNQLMNNPKASRTDISKELDISEQQVRTAMDFLRKNNRIHHEGPAFGGSWIIDE